MHTGLNSITCSFFLLVLVSTVNTCSAEEYAPANKLTMNEELAGWKLLFDGESTDHFRNYKKETVSTGWKVADGALIRAEKGAGDLITKEMYDNFELTIDFKIEKGGNSGLMFLVTEEGKVPWHTGPEIQLQDHINGHDPQKCGWLYQLYAPSAKGWTLYNNFPKPNVPDVPDSFRGHDVWNQLYLRIDQGLGQVMLNGMKYYTFKLGSKEWEEVYSKSKFSKFPGFAKASKGHLCLQDHGNTVAFRNIKIRELGEKAKSYDISSGKPPVKVVPAFTEITWDAWEPVDADGKAVPFRPIEINHAGDGSNRLFVSEQHGRIYALERTGTTAKATTFLNIEDKVSYSDKMNEEGLLGVAFHPDFKHNHQVYIYYSSIKEPHTSIISRFTVDPKSTNEKNSASEEILLKIPQPFWNHNGGTVLFGKDGYLYIGLGDGGGGDDPYGNAQNLSVFFGKVLRIDVNNKGDGKPYAIPADNPFVGKDKSLPEIYAYGIRNPWRFSFDRKNGDLWLCDVGQNLYEEINLVPKGGNLGWSVRESAHPFGNLGVDYSPDMVEPVFEYDHGIGKSITGGIMYRGKKLPQLEGHFVYGDYVAGTIYALKYDPAQQKATANYHLPSQNITVITFGEDEAGEVFFSMVDNKGLGIFTFAPAE